MTSSVRSSQDNIAGLDERTRVSLHGLKANRSPSDTYDEEQEEEEDEYRRQYLAITGAL